MVQLLSLIAAVYALSIALFAYLAFTAPVLDWHD